MTGAPAPVTVDGAPVAAVGAGDRTRRAPCWPSARPTEHGLRTYVLFAGGGLDVPAFLGSAATFTLGRFGGHGGRALRTGDVLHGGDGHGAGRARSRRPARPPFTSVLATSAPLEGPHAAPEFFTEEDIHDFYAADWKVHFNSARTGVRLVGPKPRWARTDGGEAGLHPSNIHDTPYSVGAVDYTGDMPVLLGPDGPSLGGFVCPATVADRRTLEAGPAAPRRHGPLPAGDGRRRAAPRDRRRRRPGPATATSRTAAAATTTCWSSSARCSWTWPCGCGCTP